MSINYVASAEIPNMNGAVSRLIVVTMILALACSSKEHVYPVIDEDFCADIHIEDHPLSDYLTPFDSIMTSRTGVYVLEEGDNSMVARAWLSEAAEKSIDIQYFIFSADNVGLIAVDYLLRAADRGVKVRIIVDDIMVEADADELLAINAHPNIDIRIYNPTSNIGKNLPQKLYSLASDFQGFNQRMHNKTFIVDTKAVITGGRNIANEYFDYDHEYNFRDRDVLLLGKVTRDIQDSFEDFWSAELSVPVDQLAAADSVAINMASKFEYLHQYACDPRNFWPQVRERIKAVPAAFQRIQTSGELVWVDSVSFVSDIPGKNSGEKGLGGGGASTDALIDLIRSAKHSISIQSPYLVTTELGRKLLEDAVKRGVVVRILTNSLSSTDNLEAFSGYRRDRKSLLKTGVQIYEFKPDAEVRRKIMTGELQKAIDYAPVFGLHAKSMVVDKAVAIVGTFNFDPRSANLNTECVTIIRNSTIAVRLHDIMEVDMQAENAWQTTLTSNPDVHAGRMKRFKTWLRGVVPKSVL